MVVHSFPHQYVAATPTADMLGNSRSGVLFRFGGRRRVQRRRAARDRRGRVGFVPYLPHDPNGAPGGSRRRDHPRPDELAVGGNRQFLLPVRGVHRLALGRDVHADATCTSTEPPRSTSGTSPWPSATTPPRNPDAFFRDPLTIEDYLAFPLHTKPLHLLDCDYPVDSGSALIFTTEERARDLAKKPVFFESWAMGTTDAGDFHLVEDMTHSSPWRAAPTMWGRTDLTPSDVDVAGLYDGFTFIAMQWLEALGFCGEGESGPFVAEGNTRPRGAIPTNTDGGACNVGRRHGANFFIEVTRQLRGER